MEKKRIPMNAPRAEAIRCQTAIRKAWLYCRIASEDTLALEMQEQHLREYACQRGWRVVGISTDQHTGTSLFRPGLVELSKAVAAGEMDMVLVFNLSRLCRSTEDAALYWSFLRKHGVDLYSISEGKVDLSVNSTVCEILKKIRTNPAAGVAHVKSWQ